jgi:hypothetical protein
MFNIKDYTNKIKNKLSSFFVKNEVADFSQSIKDDKSQLAEKEQRERIAGTEIPKIIDQKQQTKAKDKITQGPSAEDREKEESAVLGTNLIKGEVVSFFDWRKGLTILFYFLGLGVLVVGLTYGSLFIWENYKKEQSQIITASAYELKQNILLIQKDLKDVSQLQKKLGLVERLLDRHIYWTNIFNFLEDNTLAEVTYGNFNGSLDGQFNLPAKAKNFYVIAEQLKSFRKNEDVVSASTKGGNLAAGEEDEGSHIEFDLELTVSKDLFYRYEED